MQYRRLADHALAASFLLAVLTAQANDPDSSASNAPQGAETPGSPGPTSAPESTSLAPIIVNTSRFRDARIELSPSVGTTIYSVDSDAIANLSQGEDSSFDEVLEHLPGVSKDSKASGSLHVRDDHGNVQYRINGVELPENISGFGLSIDTRFVDQLNFLTGALPAQYGLRTAGVVDIQTKEGNLDPGGSISYEGGSHQTNQVGVQGFGGSQTASYYLSASGMTSRQGIENPSSSQNALHDDTSQLRFFGNFNWYLDTDTRLGLIAGTYHGKYQIPDKPDQSTQYTLSGVGAIASSALNESQYENNQFVLASLQSTIGDLDYQVSVFHQYSNLHYIPDVNGDLEFNGLASENFRSNSANGIQLDSSWKYSKNHTVRFGAQYTSQLTSSNNSTLAFPANIDGTPSSATPTSAIVDDSSKLGILASIYAQDEWRIDPKLTLNYGLRFDQVNAFIAENQWSPRLNIAYKWSDDTLIHAGFSRYFSPPPQELLSQSSLALYAGTTAAPAVNYSDHVRAERTSYYDLGFGHSLSSSWTVSMDAYYKDINNLLDEGQFGPALILTPFNYATGSIKGLELSTTYNHRIYSAYANLALARAQATDIISGQSTFSASDLAYIANHSIYLDHDQRVTASLGGAIHLDPETRIAVDALYGSGLRTDGVDANGNSIPNGDHMPAYVVVNTTLSHEWKVSPGWKTEGRLSILNLFDRVYELRSGDSVGLGAPQYGLRRSLYGSVSIKF